MAIAIITDIIVVFFILHSSFKTFFIFFRPVFLYDEVLDDEVLALHGVFAHVILQELLHLVGLVEGDLLKAHVGPNEGGKLLRGYFSKTLESGYLGVGTQL